MCSFVEICTGSHDRSCRTIIKSLEDIASAIAALCREKLGDYVRTANTYRRTVSPPQKRSLLVWCCVLSKMRNGGEASNGN